jgi:hypothetical protein
METIVECSCGATLFDLFYHEVFAGKTEAIAACTRRAALPHIRGADEVLRPIENDLDEHFPPPYGKPGRLLVDVYRIYMPGDEKPFSWTYDWKIEHVDYDADTSVFWLFEHGTLEYEMKSQGVEFGADGRYLFAAVVGHYHRGDGWTTDDDEEWHFGQPVKVDDQYELDHTDQSPKPGRQVLSGAKP